MEQSIMNEMKSEIANKTECMIDSYMEVVKKFKYNLSEIESYELKEDEIFKRADMFWNIALQKIERESQAPQQSQSQGQRPPVKTSCQEKAEAKVKAERENDKQVIANLRKEIEQLKQG